MFPAAVEPIFRYGAYIPAQILVVSTLVAFVLGFRVRSWWAWTVTAIGLLTFAVGLLVHYPPLGTDIHFFWLAGRDVCAGIDPYRNAFCLNPPSALPLYALFGLFPYPEVLAVWTTLNAIGIVFLAVTAHYALSLCSGSEGWRLPAPMVGVVTAALVLSGAAQLDLLVGQFSVLVTLALFAALVGRMTGRSSLAGAGLALASIKPATMLPFLFLFFRKRDRFAWAWMFAIGLLMTITFTSLGALPGRLGECLANIGLQSQTGGMNNPIHRVNVDLIGLDRALYYLGAGNGLVLRLIHGAVVVVLLGWVAWRINRRDTSDAAAWSLVAIASMLFLYHRVYDVLILAVPLLYTVGRSRVEQGMCRWSYTGCAAAILGVLFFRNETVQLFSYNPPFEGVLRHVAQAVIVPHAVWLLLAALFFLSTAERLRRRLQVAEETPVEAMHLSGVAIVSEDGNRSSILTVKSLLASELAGPQE
jgi:hypothetical protein